MAVVGNGTEGLALKESGDWMAQRNSRWCCSDASVDMAMFNKCDEKRVGWLRIGNFKLSRYADKHQT